MNIYQYQRECKRTCPTLGTEIDRQHMILGVISEIGEIADAYKKYIAYGKPFDRVNLVEECIDVFWYLCNSATFISLQIDELRENYNFINIEESGELVQPVDFIFDFLQSLHFGDIILTTHYWYSVCLKLGLTHEEIEKGFDNNIAKLKIRFPEGFSEEKALNRNINLERKELEK